MSISGSVISASYTTHEQVAAISEMVFGVARDSLFKLLFSHREVKQLPGTSSDAIACSI